MYQYKEYEHLAITKKGSVAKLMLNRPKVRNAISDVTLEELDSAFKELELDDEVKVVIFRRRRGCLLLRRRSVRPCVGDRKSRSDGVAHPF